MISPPRIRLVALDLDGTLIGDDLVVRPRVRAAVEAARAQGAAITIVTGRMFAAAKPFATTLGITGPIVCYQGAAIFDVATGATLRETPVAQDVTREVLDWAHEHGVHAQCYADDVLYVDEINRFSRRYTALARVEPHLVRSLRESSSSTSPNAPTRTSPRCARSSASARTSPGATRTSSRSSTRP